MKCKHILLLFLLVLSVAACGKKPTQLDGPPGKEPTGYPRVYPKPWL